MSSHYLDEHENSCTENLTVAELKKFHEIPNTKIKSTEINMIKSHSSDNEDFTSVERTPSRNKVVHQVSNSSSSLKLGSSPFGIKGMVKIHSQKQPNLERPHYNNNSRGTGGLELTKLLASDQSIKLLSSQVKTGNKDSGTMSQHRYSHGGGDMPSGKAGAQLDHSYSSRIHVPRAL